MKRVEYFNTKEELERYYENGVPSTVLAIVQPDAETAAVLYTSSNNSPINPGQTEEQGGGGKTIDPVWGVGLDIWGAIENDTWPVTADMCQTAINYDFTVETENNEVVSASWKYVESDGVTETIFKYVANGDSDLNGDPINILADASNIAEYLDEYPDVCVGLSPVLVDVTMTKSSDPSTDGYNYLIEGKLYSWNLPLSGIIVEEITENGFYPFDGQLGFDVNVSTESDATLLTEVFGADENDSSKYIPFADEGDYFSYQFTCNFDGENWTGSLSNNGFALVGRMGSATQYDYDDQTGENVLHNSYTAIQMHVGNGALYLGDVFAATNESLSDRQGVYPIATDMYPNTKFYNNGFGAGPENLDMTGWASGTLTFELRIPKNLAVEYGLGYDYFGDGTYREIVHPYVNLRWSWDGVPE